ncbi:MAG: nucleoside triphosphate pyrophosphohydrolase [Desulfobacteraceae bacterium]
MKTAEKARRDQGIYALVDIVRTLRGDKGCSWDKKQTPDTMWKCLAEEVYELLEAIESNDFDAVCEETGDVLFQLVFIAELYREKGNFSIGNSIDQVKEKMIRRHPHVYDRAVLNSDDELRSQWETIKKQEKEDAGKKQLSSALDSVPSGMPALLRSYKISKCAVNAGFDWEDINGVLKKVEEEWQEFGEALLSGDQQAVATEFGDILFTLANVARFAGIHPETSLAKSTGKFEKRFRFMEEEARKSRSLLKDLPRKELDVLWERAKEKYDGHC